MHGALRVAVVHSFYSSRQPSGENRVVQDQAAALREAGHEVLLVRRDTDELETQPGYGLRTGAGLLLGKGFDPTGQIRAFAPDLVHVHNLFPNFGTRWMLQLGAPAVVSLHNYRLFCSNGLLFRDGHQCTDCVPDRSWPAVRHGCYHGSSVATVPVALSRRGRRRNIVSGAEAVITTSERSDATLRALLGDDVRTVMIPNFSSAPVGEPSKPKEERRWLAMGRMSPEKGFRQLLEEWPVTERIDLVGDGEEWAALEAMAGPNVAMHHAMPRPQLREFIPGHAGLVFPSRWLEADPQVVVEALRFGIPVIAYEGNAVADMIRAYGFGATYRDRASLQQALSAVEEDRDRMSRSAIDAFKSRWSKDAWLSSIAALYGDVINSSPRS